MNIASDYIPSNAIGLLIAKPFIALIGKAQLMPDALVRMHPSEK